MSEQTSEPKKLGRPKGSGLHITPEKETEVIGILKAGCSRNDAADAIGVSRSTLHEHIDRSEDFAERVKKAEYQGKRKHIDRIANADAWQASAWFLERKYYSEFGNKQKLEHTGENGGAIQNAVSFEVVGRAAKKNAGDS